MLSTKSLRILRGLLGVAAFLLTAWTCIWAFLLLNRIVLAWSEDDYLRGTLTVEATEMEVYGRHDDGGHRTTIWWALGTVRVDPSEAAAGEPLEHPGERLSLKPVLDEPASEPALAAAVPPGTAYEVWFHPGMPKAVSQDEWLRVVHHDPALFDDARRMRNAIAVRTVLPLGLALVGFWLTHRTIRRRERSPGG